MDNICPTDAEVTVDKLWAEFDDWTNEARLDPFLFISEKYPNGIRIVQDKESG